MTSFGVLPDQLILSVWASSSAGVAAEIESKLNEVRGYRALSVSVTPNREGSGYLAFILIEAVDV